MIIDKTSKTIIIKVLIKEILIMSKKKLESLKSNKEFRRVVSELSELTKNMEKERKKKLAATPFRYYNSNPYHKRTNDCVIRAIGLGTGDGWENTARKLTEYMIQTGEMINTPELYGKYLENIGWKKQKQPVYPNRKKMRVGDFARQFKGKAVIHAGNNHVSYIEDGKIWDIWNCENEIMGVYWTPEEV